jgi:flagellar basal-body rod protein FlgC
MSGIFSIFKITSSALTAQRLRMDVLSNNVANAETTRTEAGGPFQRQLVVFTAGQIEEGVAPAAVRAQHANEGVRVSEIITDDTPGHRAYDPTHPDADEDGFVTYPNVNIATEMTDMLSATRSYEANVTVFNSLKTMVSKALDIGRA